MDQKTKTLVELLSSGNVRALEQSVGRLRKAMPFISVADAMVTALPHSLRTLADAVASERITTTFKQQASAQGLALQALRDTLPKVKFAGYMEAMTTPAASLQETIGRITLLLGDAEQHDDGPPIPPPALAPQESGGAPAGLLIGDEVIATVHRPPAAHGDASWWAGLSADMRLTIILFLLSLIWTSPSTIKDTQDLLGGDESPTKEQMQTLVDASQSTARTLMRLAELEQRTADKHTETEQYHALILQGLAQRTEMAGRPCEVTTGTTLRAIRASGPAIHQLDPGLLVLCLTHEGKWLEVSYQGPDDEEIRGWVRKKHLRWE
ncbi:hypothetical protein H8Z72_22915 (plasmid) [Xanthomonas citri pv. citri]|uniref:hypothetical protein n=1 Tax=Xanthomonas citri TaxID=346 RepID=UPI0019317EB0|nr:hypothetical protein [Xanthomonas citri]QRD62617.1 hypothetical protein H8Z74_23270 [Xanthomonas citri pv. citri]QRD67151.1 hypothetical protein H8Z73_22245 [Xanthomonas citri pv. citri]QRD71803.1 hypothetical protein H8Z72_22915 [Xanthomonas citri pv. citri]